MSNQQMMIDVPRRTLLEIVAKYGRSVCENPKRCKALLRDYCGTHRREINVLIAALEERVGEELLAAGRSATPREVLLSRLTKRLENHLALTEDAARWAVDSWALALGVLSEAEAEARGRNEAGKDQRKLETADARSPKSVVAEDDDDREDTVAQRLLRQKPGAGTKQPPAPFAPPAPTRPTNKSPINVAPSSPAPVLAVPPRQVPAPKSRRTTTPASQPDPQRPPADTMPRRRRRGKLRGCFVGCLLFVILSLLGFFAVPFIVTVLREEQQQQQQPTIEQPRSP